MVRIVQKSKSYLRDEDGTTMVEFAVCVALFLLMLFAVLDFSRLGYNWVLAEKSMQKAVRLASLRPPICEGVPTSHLRRIDIGTSSTYPAGTLCSTDMGICQQIDVSCTLNQTAWNASGNGPTATNFAADAAAEIWDPRAAGITTLDGWPGLKYLLPDGATMENVRISYNYDRNLGFIGGPYVPIVTATLEGPFTNSAGQQLSCGSQPAELPGSGTVPAFCFEFVTPLSALAATAGAANADQIHGDDDNTAVGATIPFPKVSVTLPAEDMNRGNNG